MMEKSWFIDILKRKKMKIKEIQEAKIKLECDIETLLNYFDKNCGTKICNLDHQIRLVQSEVNPILCDLKHCIKLKIEI